MPRFTMPVRFYMTAPVHTIRASAKLVDARTRLDALGISSLPVVDDADKPVGIISLTDLLRVGRRQAGTGSSAQLLTLPDLAVAEHATPQLLSVAPETPLEEAAKQMVKTRVHRLLVMSRGELVGIISTRDMLTAVLDKRVNKPLSDYMSSPLYTVRATEPISLATERLERAHVTAIVVIEENGWPVGIFRQREALESRDLPRSTPIEDVMSAAILCQSPSTKLYRAAAHATAMAVRRVIVTEGMQAVGVLASLDFVRAVAG